MEKNKWYAKKFIWVIIFILVITSLFLIIHYAYLKGTADGKANTAFSAHDMIIIVIFIGQITLGIIAICQTNRVNDQAEKANKLAEQKLNMEQDKLIPDFSATTAQVYQKKYVIAFTIKNDSEYAAYNITFEPLEILFLDDGTRYIKELKDDIYKENNYKILIKGTKIEMYCDFQAEETKKWIMQN